MEGGEGGGEEEDEEHPVSRNPQLPREGGSGEDERGGDARQMLSQ